MPTPKILVANRGEIAVRVMRTCREMGIPTVAVYSEPDRAALHVLYATEAYPVGPAPSSDSYLKIDRIIDVAKRSGATAIHPGYGFLSEKAELAEACAKEGIIFIGPSAEAIRKMGEKTLARRTMMAANVPVVPGTEAPVASLEEAEKAASEIGYPLMLKAAAGGGGKGMRLVKEAAQLSSAFDTARREAEASFGDGSVYLEKYIEQPRHIEVQILGDQTGKVIHLNERECSIQRRHQKVVEESPSPIVDEQMRQKMGEVAVRAAEAVSYVGAGTVEFLVDAQKNFYFLEMNTRLQVEHPVTELTCRVDLVREQINIAHGEPMSAEMTAPAGHAIEVRIYAENPAKGFMPSPGHITYLRQPGGFGVRVDTGVYAGFTVTPYYDPMIAKLIVHGNDRAQAIGRMARALSEYVVNGVTTNVTFLRWIMRHEDFKKGQFDTGFLDRNFKGRMPQTNPKIEEVALIAAAIRQHEYTHELADKISSSAPDGTRPSAWRSLARREAVSRRSH